MVVEAGLVVGPNLERFWWGHTQLHSQSPTESPVAGRGLVTARANIHVASTDHSDYSYY